MEWMLDATLIVLLTLTLFHALRLERALGVLKRDRAALQELVAGFNSSTQAAEQGVARLRTAAEGVGRSLARQIEAAQALKDDLGFLAERGDGLADRLDGLVRRARGLVPEAPGRVEPQFQPPEPVLEPVGEKRVRSQAERDLLTALRMAR